GWAAERTGRAYRGGFTREQLEAINAAESERVADAFLSAPFLRGQYRFLWKKNKRVPAAIFFALCHSRPLWSRLL
ncbi:MAG: enoyl-CoA hydratase/isomerase family protein, partial [Deltaproteobacteria bacterium]|nr:enoyl-CoA hydratase/isomerase family protein [Deltaproteobacteria bacterium]